MKSLQPRSTLNVRDLKPLFSSEDEKYDFQQHLTRILDNTASGFDQSIINEIVLWKLNRYAVLDADTLRLLNTISPNDGVLDKELTRQILMGMFGDCSRGFRLPMASTVLHFRNMHIYQIIDQRVYRLIYEDAEYKEAAKPQGKVEIYLKYLEDLRTVCERIPIPFEMSSRWLYNTDKRVNKDKKLEGYGTGKARAEE